MVDFSFLEKFTKGDQKKMKRYISLYLNEAHKTFLEMKKNIEEKDWKQLRINAHSLKPQVDFMGIKHLKNILIEIEDAVKMNKLHNINKLFDDSFSLHINSEVTLNEKLKSLEIIP